MWYEPDAPVGHMWGPLEVPGPETGTLDVRVRALTQQVADQLAEGIARHPQDWHMLQRMWLDAPATVTALRGVFVRIGIVCPYSFDVPGGVQNHVRDLAEALIGLGHDGERARAGRRRRAAAAVRGAGRPGGAGARTTARSRGSRSGRSPPPGCGAGWRAASSTCCTCTSR